MSIETDKSALRIRAKGAIARIDPATAFLQSAAVCANVCSAPAWAGAATVLLYAPFAGEVDVSSLFLAAAAAGKQIAVPRIDWRTRSMAAAEVRCPSEDIHGYQTPLADFGLIPGRRGLLKPPPGARVIEPAALDLIIVPGLAFDHRGNRLGRGAGFYDRFLSACRGSPRWRGVCVGAAFACQVFERIPVEAWDIPLDAIATPDRYITVTQDA